MGHGRRGRGGGGGGGEEKREEEQEEGGGRWRIYCLLFRRRIRRKKGLLKANAMNQVDFERNHATRENGQSFSNLVQWIQTHAETQIHSFLLYAPLVGCVRVCVYVGGGGVLLTDNE